MKFFKDPKNWRNELATIGLSAGTVMFFLSFLVLGNPTVWLLVACVPLLLPLLFGSWLKMKVPALVILSISIWIIVLETTRFNPIKVVSPDGKTAAILWVKGNNNCYTVIIGEQTFYTAASIYHNARGVWNGNDLFVLESSDIGPTEFRRENGVWRATPEEHLHRTPLKARETNP